MPSTRQHARAAALAPTSPLAASAARQLGVVSTLAPTFPPETPNPALCSRYRLAFALCFHRLDGGDPTGFCGFVVCTGWGEGVGVDPCDA